MFSDNILKLEKYKEQILNDFIKRGIYPTDEAIASYINEIDLNLSMFKNYDKVSGEKFNVKEYNESLKLIYNDLCILYEIYNKLATEEYNKLQNYIYSYINELQSVVETYKSHADYENNSTTLGDTLLYQDKNYTITHENSTTIYNLDNIETHKGSVLACIANTNNLNDKNIEFKLGDLSCIPYNYSNEYLKIPGDKTINYYSETIDQDYTIPLLMNINPDYKNKYKIFSAKDNILVYDKTTSSYELCPIINNTTSLIFNGKKKISFYILNGTEISFKFNSKPEAANFLVDVKTHTITKEVMYYQIDTPENFYFEINFKGKAYGLCEKGLIKSNKLYYTGLNLASDFYIQEIKPGEKINYPVQLKIFNDNDNNIDVKNIIIKEIEE